MFLVHLKSKSMSKQPCFFSPVLQRKPPFVTSCFLSWTTIPPKIGAAQELTPIKKRNKHEKGRGCNWILRNKQYISFPLEKNNIFPQQLIFKFIDFSLTWKTRMFVQGQLVKPAVCFSDLYACEELIHSFIWHKLNNIMLKQQTPFNIYE